MIVASGSAKAVVIDSKGFCDSLLVDDRPDDFVVLHDAKLLLR